jgi:exopolysaccharide biosynthesis WecB/TagA/CpsF family protein
MKVSIITPTYNSEKTILDNIKSISSQTYKNIEHIIIDNFSTDSTKKIIEKYKNKNLKFFQKETGIYEAMNYGIKKSNGKIIGIIGSDDIFQSTNSIHEIVKKFNRKNIDIYTGGVVYFKNNNYKKILRKYSFKNFDFSYFTSGLMPPHPSTFIKKDIYKKYGGYLKKYKIASDFEFLYRILKKNKNFLIEDKNIVRMRIGGVSTRGVSSVWKISKEIFDILKEKKVRFSKFRIYLRILYKLKQSFFINSDRLNVNFNSSFYEKNVNKFKLINNIKKISHIKNYILVALNLAFLGSWIKLKKFNTDKIFFWPDGIFTKIIQREIKKIPGRDLINNFITPKYIKKIIVLGNCSTKNLNYLKEKFKNKIIKHINLPYESWENLYKLLPKKIKTNMGKNQLVLITIPTPKQEMLALELSKKNSNYKIICIGGSLNIASGEEKATPDLMYIYNLEFLWRLKFDSYRRIKRLFVTFVYFILGAISLSYNDIKIKKIN